jgi:hypothetical protein
MTSAMSALGTVGVTEINRVELALAADAQMLFLARMTGAAVATRADFNYEQVEDLRLAIDELCIGLMSTVSGPGRITFVFQWDEEGALEVTGRLTPDGEPSVNGHGTATAGSDVSFELSERILDALVDDHGAEVTGGAHRAWLRMRRREPLA